MKYSWKLFWIRYFAGLAVVGGIAVVFIELFGSKSAWIRIASAVVVILTLISGYRWALQYAASTRKVHE